MAGRPESSRRCTCKLETYPHLVPQREWADHRAARSRLETQAHAAVADSVAESVAHAALSEGANESNSIPADTTQIGQEALKALQAIMSARSTKPKQPTRQKQDDHLLMTIAKKIEETIVSVEQSSNTSLEAQRQAANAAWYEGVLVAAASLQNIKPSPEKSFVEERLKVLEILVKDLKSALPEETEPFFYDSAYTRVNPVAKLNVIAQVTVLLGLVCHFLLRLAEDSVNFILGTAMILVKATMALDVKMNDDGSVEFDEFQNTILKDIPKSLHIAMSRLNLDGKTVMYAACPSCNHIHPPDLSTSDTPSWPDKCQNTIVGKEGRSVCGAALLRRGKASSRPIKPFLAPCFLDYLARLLSDPENERMMDEVCDDAVNTKPSDRDFVQDVFQAEFVQSFKDRDGIVLFIKRAGKRMRLLFSISMDFFPPFGSRKRSNSNSIGLIKVSCLNLRLIVRDKPENVFVVVVPGPSSPSKGEINPYLRPIIDVAVVGWNRGIHFSSTGTEPDTGRIVDLAFVLSANDLPAARQLAGAAAHNAHIYCTCCQGRGRSTVYNTDFSTWNTRDRDQMRSCAEAWRDAETLAEREQIYQEHGIRWSEMWRLPYWDPTRMLPPDPMHTVLEGLVHYHCRRVLKLNLLDAKKFDKSPPAYQYDFPSLDAAAPADWDMTKDIHQKSVEDIYKLLVYQISENEDSSEDENGEEDDEGEEEEEAEDEDVRKAKAKAKAKKRKRDKR
ncbi:hypothetical protein MSAN_02516500 [Mycena sanguinolenta]|uniref:Uncharacterized protein n=1 Tax=Mycena sanguinolenta TaxID=230812 RepID=A0A8H6TXW1_9AGAR|nr:hypothetical protein MSAN_02516500 [Mycena sanguinolenta]